MYHSSRLTWNLSITNLLLREPQLPGHCILLFKFFTVCPSSVIATQLLNVAKERDFGKHKIPMNWKLTFLFACLVLRFQLWVTSVDFT